MSLGIKSSVEDVDLLGEVLEKIALRPRAKAGNPFAAMQADIQKQMDDFIQAAAQKVYAPCSPKGDVVRDTSRN